MQSNWKHAISWSRGHRSSYAPSSGPDTGELRRDFRVAFARGHRRSLRIARKTNARDCIMCLHECNGAHMSVRGTIPCDTVAQLAVANSWNRTLSVVSFHDFKTLSEPEKRESKRLENVTLDPLIHRSTPKLLAERFTKSDTNIFVSAPPLMRIRAHTCRKWGEF